MAKHEGSPDAKGNSQMVSQPSDAAYLDTASLQSKPANLVHSEQHQSFPTAVDTLPKLCNNKRIIVKFIYHILSDYAPNTFILWMFIFGFIYQFRLVILPVRGLGPSFRQKQFFLCGRWVSEVFPGPTGGQRRTFQHCLPYVALLFLWAVTRTCPWGSVSLIAANLQQANIQFSVSSKYANNQ